MIAPILENIRTDIEALEWVERFGGVVRKVSRPVAINTDGLPQIVLQEYPISCNVSAMDCWSNDRYLDLVPNDRYKSVTYFEDKQGLRLNGVAKNGSLEFTGTVRFIAWLNMKALGYDTCHFGEYVAASMLPLLDFKLRKITNPFPCLLTMQPIQCEARGKDIFEGYSYADQQQLLFYPYDYFAINININIIVDKQCLPTYETKTPILC